MRNLYVLNTIKLINIEIQIHDIENEVLQDSMTWVCKAINGHTIGLSFKGFIKIWNA